MTTQEITLNQSSDAGLYTQLLRGRYVTSIDDGIITLDDGTELHIDGNDGCGGCESGWYWLENVYKQGSRRARILKHREGGRGDVTIYSYSQSVWAINTQKGTRA